MSNPKIYIGSVSAKVKVLRMVWNIVYYMLFRPFPTKIFWPWRWLMLRLFGAKVSYKSLVYSSAEIWAPWNLRMEEGCCLGPHVICYNQALVTIKYHATISQYACLCTAGHDISDVNNAKTSLVVAPISIGKDAWIAMKAFVGMGVEIGDRSIVGATASVYKDVEAYSVVGGNPAKLIKYINRQSL
ncbi:MAG: putative colanic acid biosynthesis acetyltransferase [Bacteroidales bacterium]|nr:putative colanic acid biosynthesis acetyltransferase [Bacteroidales bacterium]